MRDDRCCLHCGLDHPPGSCPPSEWPRIEAEREARIRADERARIVAYLRRQGDARLLRTAGALYRCADAIERQEHTDDHP